jgi:hypothetical protein
MTRSLMLEMRKSMDPTDQIGEPARVLERPEPSTPLTVRPLRHVCGRADCPVSTDVAGNKWCWCRTIDILDLCA